MHKVLCALSIVLVIWSIAFSDEESDGAKEGS